MLKNPSQKNSKSCMDLHFVLSIFCCWIAINSDVVRWIRTVRGDVKNRLQYFLRIGIKVNIYFFFLLASSDLHVLVIKDT